MASAVRILSLMCCLLVTLAVVDSQLSSSEEATDDISGIVSELTSSRGGNRREGGGRQRGEGRRNRRGSRRGGGGRGRNDNPGRVRGQPNILFILTDDQGWNDIGYNNEGVKTPNIDRLASEGRKLTRNYVAPTCSPSRASLLTGKYAFKVGAQFRVFIPGDNGPLPIDIPMLPQYLKDEGYTTHLVGKWHMGECSDSALPTNRGFDTFLGHLGGATGHYTHTAPYDGKMYFDFFRDDQPETIDTSEYSQDRYDEEVLRLLRLKQNDNSPFFILHTTQLPHTPSQVPDEFRDRHDANIDNLRRIHLGMLSRLDDSVALFEQELDTLGLRDNTIIIFSSDNGGGANTMGSPPGGSFTGNNYPLRGSKSGVYEGGVRVPAFINSPLLPESLRGTETDELFHITDWLPTIVRWARSGVRGVDRGNDRENNRRGISGVVSEVVDRAVQIATDGIQDWVSDLLADIGFNQDFNCTIDGVDQSDMLFNENGESGREEAVIQIFDPFFFLTPENNDITQVLIRKVGGRLMKLIIGPAVLDSEQLRDFQDFSDQWSQPSEWEVLNIDKRVITGGTTCGQPDGEQTCLFDLDADPSEETNISDEPDIVSDMRSRLTQYAQDIQEPINDNERFATPFEIITDNTAGDGFDGTLVTGYCTPENSGVCEA